MGNRISKVYTRTGDQGTTGLGDGSRIWKADKVIEAIGSVDEANSAIGVVLAEISKDDIYDTLISVQNALFEIGAELSTPSYRSTVDADAVEFLETKLDELNDTLPPLKEFILPGGNRASAACDLARSVVRRAERRVEAYMFDAGGNAHINAYLNRLSDLLFVIGRKLRTTEVMWDHERR